MNQVKVPINWAPRRYQFPLWEYLEKGGKRAVAIWHRRAGKDLTSVNWTATAMLRRPGLYWHLLPTYNQGRKIVWDGMTKTGRGFKDHFPEQLICGVNNTDMKLEFRNGAIWQVVGTDNVDRLVGSNPVGCVFSEYSLQDPQAWEYIRPILAENGGWALFIYTPRGRNHGYDLLRMAEDNPAWHSQILTCDETGAITQEAIDEERAAGMPEEMIQQEFYCSFDAPLVGAFYGELMNKAMEDGRLTSVPIDPHLEVNTAWDLGVDDSTSITFFQQHGFEFRIIDYYENTGEGLPHYARILREKAEQNGFVYGRHYGPHDIKVRELGSGKSRMETAKELGIRFIPTPRLSVEDGREAIRGIIPMCYFDKTRCNRLIEALRQHRKEWDGKKQLYTLIDDWTSHPHDSFKTLAIMSRHAGKRRSKGLPSHAEADYDPYSL